MTQGRKPSRDCPALRPNPARPGIPESDGEKLDETTADAIEVFSLLGDAVPAMISIN
jgi:hypothetical protein